MINLILMEVKVGYIILSDYVIPYVCNTFFGFYMLNLFSETPICLKTTTIWTLLPIYVDNQKVL